MNPAETTKVITESGLSPSVQMVLLIVFILLLLSAPAALFVRDWRPVRLGLAHEGQD